MLNVGLKPRQFYAPMFVIYIRRHRRPDWKATSRVLDDSKMKAVTLRCQLSGLTSQFSCLLGTQSRPVPNHRLRNPEALAHGDPSGHKKQDSKRFYIGLVPETSIQSFLDLFVIYESQLFHLFLRKCLL